MAEILGLVSAAVSLADRVHSFASKLKNAPDTAQEICREMVITREALSILLNHIKATNTTSNDFDKTTVLFCAVDGCSKQLEKIDSKVSLLVPKDGSTSGPSMLGRARWAMEEDEVTKMMQSLRGYVQVFHFAASMDGL